MKQFLFVCLSLAISITVHAQISREDLQKYRQEQKEALSKYAKEKEREFKNYRDSLNQAYADYLEETWKSFNLQRQERSFKPMPQPPVYHPPKPLPVQPLPPTVSPILPTKPLPPPVIKPAPIEPKYPVSAEFFGTTVRLQASRQQSKPLSGISEKEVADYWRFLSGLSVEAWAEDMQRIQNELKLNDWGLYQLTNRLFQTYFPAGTENEQVVFSVFMLNQLGYRAKIGKTNDELLPLVAFQQTLSNTPFFSINSNGKSFKYFVLNPQHKRLASVQTCGAEYGNEGNLLNVNVTQIPDFREEIETRQLTYQDKTYVLECNRNLSDFYATYPCVDFSVYAGAPLDERMLERLQSELMPSISGKTQEEAVNFLLHFVQNAFRYQTDDAQFGYEKWNFAEETLLSSFSDCDDRAIFFAQMIKKLLNMPVVLVHYPGYHLATAMRFDDPQIAGDYVLMNGVKYLICDPTYINADRGAEMPELRNVEKEIIRLGDA